MKALKPPGPEFTLYGVYHHHEYGGSIHLVWADHEPSEQEVVVACGMEFEPDKDEWMVIEPTSGPATVATATVEH